MKRLLILLLALMGAHTLTADIGLRVGARLGGKHPNFWVHDTMVGTTPKQRHFFEIDAGRYASDSYKKTSTDVKTGQSRITYSHDSYVFNIDYRFLFQKHWYFRTSPTVSYAVEMKEPSVYDDAEDKKGLQRSSRFSLDILSDVRVGCLFETNGWQGKAELYLDHDVGGRVCGQYKVAQKGAWQFFADTYAHAAFRPRAGHRPARTILELFGGGRTTWKGLSAGAGYTIGAGLTNANDQDIAALTRSPQQPNNENNNSDVPRNIMMHTLSGDLTFSWKGLAAVLFGHATFGQTGGGKSAVLTGLGGKLCYTF